VLHSKASPAQRDNSTRILTMVEQKRIGLVSAIRAADFNARFKRLATSSKRISNFS
jgi:hypothetical protein